MNHIVSLFDKELKYLENKIMYMGNFAIDMVNDSVQAMVNKDIALAKQVISNDVQLDNTERSIDEKATAIIAKRQPMAVDLRQIIGTIRIASDLERIGDKAKNIAKRAIRISGDLPIDEFYPSLEAFAQITIAQLRKALDAYKLNFVEGIYDVLRSDDEVDEKYNAMFRELLDYMMKNPDNITACTHLLFCAKSLERVGDHATNIVESLHYIIKGEYLPLDAYHNSDNL